jgi:1-acyl-sn-glycerol-3-phosphate acyltransferase
MNESVYQILDPLMKKLRAYHQHTVVGMSHVPKAGRALVVVNHSLATYDIGLLFSAIQTEMGRQPRPLADNLFFRLPYLGELVEAIGGKQGTPENAEALLEAGELVGVAPGGMQEALRPSYERYQLRWDKRKGFVRLAIETQTPILLAVCPRADDIYEVYENKFTHWAYDTFRIPLFIARGLGPTFFPRPTPLTHFISPLMHPPVKAADPAAFKRQVDEFHKKLVKRAELLIGEAIAYRRP